MQGPSLQIQVICIVSHVQASCKAVFTSVAVLTRNDLALTQMTQSELSSRLAGEVFLLRRVCSLNTGLRVCKMERRLCLAGARQGANTLLSVGDEPSGRERDVEFRSCRQGLLTRLRSVRERSHQLSRTWSQSLAAAK